MKLKTRRISAILLTLVMLFGITSAVPFTADAAVAVKSAVLSQKTATLGVGEAFTLKASVKPTNAKTKFKWTTSKKSVAVVTTAGKVTAKKAGTANITVTTSNGKKAVCKVTVKKAPTSVKLNKTATTLGVGQTYQLTATRSSGSAGKISWTTSNKNVAAVSTSGKITAKKVGTATITAKTYNGKKAVCKVTVKKAPTSVKLNNTSLALKTGATYTLISTLSSGSAGSVGWTTSNSKVATVSGGKVTAKADGTATITVKTYNGKTATCKVVVNKKGFATINGQKIPVGGKVRVTFKLKAPRVLENYQANITFNSKYLKYDKLTLSSKASGGAMYNLKRAGTITLAGTEVMKGYNFTAGSSFCAADFTVTAAGTASVNMAFEVAMDMKDVDFVSASGAYAAGFTVTRATKAL